MSAPLTNMQMVMNLIKEDLKQNFDRASEEYNKGDYVFFFRDIRPAIEDLAKLILYDCLDERLAEDIISGRKKLILNNKTKQVYWTDQNNGKELKGSGLIWPIEKALLIRNTTRIPRDNKHFQTELGSATATLVRLYNNASEIGSHSGSRTDDIFVVALDCASFLVREFKFLREHELISAETIGFLSTLKKLDLASSEKLKEAEEAHDKTRKELDKAHQDISKTREELESLKKQATKESEESSSIVKSKLQLIESLSQTIEKLEKQLAEERERAHHIEKVSQERHTAGQGSTQLAHHKEQKSYTSIWDPGDEAIEEDDDQMDLIELSKDRSMLITGCAGSGKSIIAMHKAQKIAEEGGDVILLTLTKSLNSFMKLGKRSANYQFYTAAKWEVMGCPKADYIIVDEIQDFNRDQVKRFMDAAKTAYYFFGDSAQSIYKHFDQPTMSIEEISELTGLKPLRLYNNYRLPRNVAKITEDYVGVDVPPYKDKVYKNTSDHLPHVIHSHSLEKEINLIAQILEENRGKKIAILLSNNSEVQTIGEELKRRGLSVRIKCKTSAESDEIYELDFMSPDPMVMTYHSSKGLQFDVVILPEYEGAADDGRRRTLYVAMTRTMEQLYIIYTTDSLRYPLSEVPSRLYLKE